MRTAMVDFNPRSPCGERQEVEGKLVEAGTISIHAPLVGSDFLPAKNRLLLIPISIHAPLVGSDW